MSIAGGEPAKVDSETTQTMSAPLDCGLSVTMPADQAAEFYGRRLCAVANLYYSGSREHDEVDRCNREPSCVPGKAFGQ